MSIDKRTRRDFLKACARGAGVVAVGGVAAGLTLRADADKVWQLDPDVCTVCKDSTNSAGWGRCATECVLKNSAVKAVNNFDSCGYCFICPAYFDITSRQLDDGTFEGLICPQDAINRRLVGEADEYDPNNNFFEYTIDESKCTGCGLCVQHCKPPGGNGSLRLQVRHNLCEDCNQCTIATACPPTAFYRSRVTDRPAGYKRPESPARKRSAP
ncbi:MAG: 4Fe-4S binding protein [Planctomycetes bacterium]|nr:4Fe-4S binding protein [Planctomycetota bacterium]